MDAGDRVSVVLPVFNEAAVIERVVEDIVEDVVNRVGDGEIVVVDDSSSDETPRVLERLEARYPILRIVRNETNLGHGPTVVRGLDEARHPWIFLADSDAQFLMRDFGALWDARHDADLVLGRRVTRAGSRHRLVLGRIVESIVSRLAGRSVFDPNVPFKLLRRSLWRDLRVVVDDDARVPSIMIALGAALRGWRIVHVSVTHLPRTHAPSTLRGLRLARFTFAALRDVLSFRRRVLRMPPRIARLEQAEQRSTTTT